MSKSLPVTFILSICFITSFGQFKVKQPREIQDVYMFSTDNWKGVGHLDWAFHDSIVYKETVIGGSVLHGGNVVKRDSFRTEKPFIFMDSGGVVAYMYQTDRGVITLLYSDETHDLTVLVIGWKKIERQLTIYDVVHFW